MKDFPRALIDARCRGAKACCKQRGFALVEEFCDPLESQVRQRVEQLVAQGIPYNAEEASRCVANAKAAIAACTMPDRLACRYVLRGSKGRGEACKQHEECADVEGAVTHCSTGSSDMGSCDLGGSSDPKGVKVGDGEACSMSCSFSSGRGHSCSGTLSDPAGVPRYCVRQEGLRCAEDGKCGALQTQGGTCSSEASCELGLRCVLGKCVPKVAVGARCERVEDCIESATCVASSCVATLPVGAACDAQPSACVADSQCVAGKCKPFDLFEDLCGGH